MAQYGRPDSDVTATNFAGFSATTPGSFYTNIDESSANDSDYVYTIGTSATYECGLSNVTDPGVHTGHTFRWRVSLSGPLGGGDDPIGYSVSLYQGATLISTYSGSVAIATVAGASQTLSSGEAGSITDYTDLRLRFVVASATSPAVRFTWAELEVPDASSDATLTPDPAEADAGANDPTPLPVATLSPSPAPGTAGANDPTPVPGSVALTPTGAYLLSYGGPAGASVDGDLYLGVEPAELFTAAVEPGLDLLPTILYPDPAPIGATAGDDPAPSAGGVTLSPSPAASHADTAAVTAPPDGGYNLTPDPAVLNATIPDDTPGPDTGAPKKRGAGCRCRCRLQLKSISVTVYGCCSLCLAGARVQLLSGGVVVAEATVSCPSGTVFLSTTATAEPFQIRVSAPGFVTQTITVVFAGGSATKVLTLVPEGGRQCFAPCGNSTINSVSGLTLYDAKGNAIALSLSSPGVYRGGRSYAVPDNFINPCELVETFPDPMPAYQYGICGFRIPPLIDIIGPGNVLVAYTVTYSSCGTVSLFGSWQMWRCTCGCTSTSLDYYVPPGSCFDYCGDGANLCPCGGWPGGGMGGQSLPAVSPTFDCETGEVFWDIPYHIGTCFAGSPAYSTAHHPLGGYGIYSVVPA